MSLLNLTNDGLPNVLVVIYAAIARSKAPLSKDALLEMVAPSGVANEDGKMARQTLLRWTELGLFSESEAGVTLTSAPEFDFHDDSDLLVTVRKAARRCALSETNNPDLWAKQSAKAADLTRSLAWLLAQDVYRTRFQDLEALELAQIADSDVRLMQNDTRYNGLKFWAHFLGFARQPGGGDIDPTVAIREVLSDCIGSGEEMPASNLVERLAAALPVLDGGAWRRAIEVRLEPQALPAVSEGQLSTSLSRALINLMMDEVLEFQNRSDVGRSIVFTGRDGLRAEYRYSWVRRPQGRVGRSR